MEASLAEDRVATEQLSQGADSSIFEINDFTNATPWESFISDIEQVFRQWGLARMDEHGWHSIPPQKQHRKVERIEYAGRRLVISLEVSGTRHSSPPDSEHEWAPAMWEMMDVSLDFPSVAHHISRWYGTQEFVLVMLDEGAEGLRSQAQANLLLSSVAIAVTNTGCITPVFIQVHQPWRQMYVGVCEGGGGGVRTNFDMVHLQHPPPQFTHLSGLLDLFKSKLRCPLPKMEAVQIAARLTYVLKHWSPDEWPVESLGDVEREMDGKVLEYLPVGAISDPVQELHLSAVWPNVTEELIVDTESHSDLQPMLAPVWTVRAILAQNPSCLLAEHLLNLLNVCYREDSVSQLLTRTLPQANSPGTAIPEFSHALDRLTEPAGSLSSPFFSSVVYSASQRIELGRGVEGVGSEGGREPLPDKDLEIVLRYLFPDAFDSETTPPTKQESSQETDFTSDDATVVRRLKSAPGGSLTFLLAKALCIVNSEHGVKALCLLWFEVVQELRYRWENGLPIRNLPEGAPDMSCCLLHQKLQMLNCCIQHKLAHEHKLNTPHRQSHSHYHDPHSQDLKSPETHSHSTVSVSTVQPADSSSTDKLAEKSAEFVTPVQEGGDSASGSEDEFFEALESQEQLSLSPRDGTTFESKDSRLRDTDRDVENESVLERNEGLESLQNDDKTSIPQVVCHDSVESMEETHSQSMEETHSQSMEETHSQSMEETRSQSMKRTRSQSMEEIDSRTKVTHHGLSEPPLTDEWRRGVAVERVGALHQCGDLVLIATGQPLCVPVTQEHTPMTEDMLWEQEKVLARLGTTEEAAQVRAKMQSSSLISDMQAFKAANPGCLLEDFVRWYSPRDWIEDTGEEANLLEARETIADACVTVDHETKMAVTTSSEVGRPLEGTAKQGVGGTLEEGGDEVKDGDSVKGAISEAVESEGWGEEWDEDWDFVGGDEEEGRGRTEGKEIEIVQEPQTRYAQGHLSVRMQQPNNAWVEAWQDAIPLAAYKQKRLFDDTKEAEKVLHSLAGLRVCDVALLVMPVVLHAALETLGTRQRSQPLASVDSLLSDASSLLASVHHPSLESLPKYQECVTLLSQAEHLLACAHSLRTKLTQGLEMKDGGGGRGERRRSELDISVEVLLQEPELVLRDPVGSVTGLALQGLLAAQVATRDLEEQELSKQKRLHAKDTFPKESGREFILRATLPRPAPYSQPSPQRMFCVVSGGHFRLAGAFSTDTNLV